MLVSSIDPACWVHWGGVRTLRHFHVSLSIRCSSSSSTSFRSDPFRTFADQLWLTRWYTQSIRLVQSIKTLQGRWGTSIIDWQLAAPLLLLLLLLLLPGWPPSIVGRSTPTELPKAAIDSARRVHQDGSMMLGYVQYWLSIRYSTPSPPPAPHHHHQSAWQRTEQQRVYEDIGMMGMDCAKGAYGDTEVTHLIIVQRITHSIFPCCALTCSGWDFVDPHNWVDPRGRVVSYLLTHFPRSSSNSCYFSWIPFECLQRCGWVLMMGLLPSSSIVSPHCPPVLPHLDCSLVAVCVGPQILVSEIDFSLMRTHKQVICGLEIAIVNLWPGRSTICAEMIHFHLPRWGFWGSWNDCKYSLSIQNH